MRPSFVVLELCETRVDSLLEPSPLELRDAVNVTLPYVLRESVRARVRRTRPPALPPTNPPSPPLSQSFKVLGMGLLSWMQLKAAKMSGSKLGGELGTAPASPLPVKLTN